MTKLASNLKYLRKKGKISQGELAEEFEVARTTMGDYERGKTEPNLEMLIRMSQKFDVAIGELITDDLTHNELEIVRQDGLRVLAISVDKDNNENIELVDTKAEAGYLDSFQDPEYIRDLPKISFPNIPNGTFRGFEIRGDSMLPMESGSIVLCSYVEQIDQIKDGKTYVVVSEEQGLVYKRVINRKEDSKLVLSSDNESYIPYEISYNNISEVWQYYAHLSFSDTKSTFNDHLEEKLTDIQNKVNEIRNVVNKGV